MHRKAFTLVEIMVVVAIIGLLAGLAIPNFIKSRETAFKNICLNNLRQLDAAKQQWALETGQLEDATPNAEDLDPYIKNGAQRLICPQDPAKSFATSYTINNITTNPTCKIKPNLHILPPEQEISE